MLSSDFSFVIPFVAAFDPKQPPSVFSLLSAERNLFSKSNSYRAAHLTFVIYSFLQKNRAIQLK